MTRPMTEASDLNEGGSSADADTQPGTADTIADLLAENAALTKALTGLTCGGSEFFIRKGDRYVADIPACVGYVQRAREAAHRRWLDAARAAKATTAPETVSVGIAKGDEPNSPPSRATGEA